MKTTQQPTSSIISFFLFVKQAPHLLPSGYKSKVSDAQSAPSGQQYGILGVLLFYGQIESSILSLLQQAGWHYIWVLVSFVYECWQSWI